MLKKEDKCCFNLETFCTEEYRGLSDRIVSLCNYSHLKINTSKTNEIMVDYICMILSVYVH